MTLRDASTLLTEAVHRPRFGLFSDVDGTLSHIVPNPPDARVTERNRELLAALRDVLPVVAAISGRGAGDIHQRVNVPGLIYVGNHGLEQWEGDGTTIMPEVAAYRPALEGAIADLRPYLYPGMGLEDKGATISFHYRQTASPEAVATLFRPLVVRAAADHGLNTFEGRMIFELRPPLEINKGTAFEGLVQRYDLDAAVFIGDDITDVDAFRAARALREAGKCLAYGVGVLSDATPESVREVADALVSGVEGVEELLAWVLKSRSASST